MVFGDLPIGPKKTVSNRLVVLKPRTAGVSSSGNSNSTSTIIVTGCTSFTHYCVFAIKGQKPEVLVFHFPLSAYLSSAALCTQKDCAKFPAPPATVVALPASYTN